MAFARMATCDMMSSGEMVGAKPISSPMMLETAAGLAYEYSAFCNPFFVLSSAAVYFRRPSGTAINGCVVTRTFELLAMVAIVESFLTSGFRRCVTPFFRSFRCLDM
ncbi:hypothetical protein IG631_00016 [Alternaria alternata]|nr:hypothetical protein IG631_00016 [Alternaria alternata]